MCRNKVMFTIVVMSVVMFATSLFAREDKALSEYRHALMETLGYQMKSMGHILKNRLPLTQHIESHARMISATAALIPAAWEKETRTGRTDSKPLIWKQWDQFKSAAADTRKESRKLAEVAAGGSTKDIFSQMKNLGITCGACHNTFRKSESEKSKK